MKTTLYSWFFFILPPPVGIPLAMSLSTSFLSSIETFSWNCIFNNYASLKKLQRAKKTWKYTLFICHKWQSLFLNTLRIFFAKKNVPFLNGKSVTRVKSVYRVVKCFPWVIHWHHAWILVARACEGHPRSTSGANGSRVENISLRGELISRGRPFISWEWDFVQF